MAINQKNTKPGQPDDFLRIQDLLYLCLARWKWFVLSLVVTVGAATVHLLRTPAVYTRTASVLIKEDSKGKSVSSDLESFSEFGLFQSGTNVNNELITFQSPALMTEVVKRLRLDMNYFVPGKFHRQVAYGLTLPVDVTISDLPENESAGFTLEVQPDGTLFLSDFIRNGTEFDGESIKGRLLDSIPTPLGKIIMKLEQLHVQVKVLTGDQKSVTLSICRRLGIETEHILTGEEMEELSEDEQLLAVEKTTVFSQLSPGQKSQIIRMLRENGHAVGFLGDGMNDLAAMTAADVGISVDTATQAAKESADVILLKKDLNVLEQGILEGRKAFANMLKYIRITASSNFGNIFSIVLASAFLPFLPMTALQLLLLNLLYDILCMTLPWDRVDADVYEKPSEWSGKTLGRFMRFFGPLSSLFDLATFAFLYFILCPALLGDNFTELSSAMQSQFAILFHTGWFLESMWTQVLILHLLRTKQLSILRSRASGVVWLVTSAGLLILTAIVYTPAAHLLGLAPLPLWYFGFLAVTILAYMLLVTAAKRWYIQKYHTLL